MSTTSTFSIEDMVIGAYNETESAEKQQYEFTDNSLESYNDIYAFEEAHIVNEIKMFESFNSIESINIKNHAKLLKRIANDFGKCDKSVNSTARTKLMSLESNANDIGETIVGNDKKGLVGFLKKMWSMICNFFKAILEKVQMFFKWIRNLFTKHITPDVASEAIYKIDGDDIKTKSFVEKLSKKMYSNNDDQSSEGSGGFYMIHSKYDGSYVWGISNLNVSTMNKTFDLFFETIGKYLETIKNFVSASGDIKDRQRKQIEFFTKSIRESYGSTKLTEFFKKNFGIKLIKKRDVKRITDITGSPNQFKKIVKDISMLNSLDPKFNKLIKENSNLQKHVEYLSGDFELMDDEIFDNIKKSFPKIRDDVSYMSKIIVKVSKYVVDMAHLLRLETANA